MLVLATLAMLVSAPADSLPDGTQLTYRGRFVAEKGDVAGSEKQFEIDFLVADRGEGRVSLLWNTEERGRGGWSWLSRFGNWELSDQLRPVGGLSPSLSYHRADGTHVVPVQAPFLTYKETLVPGVSWFEGTLESRVAAEEKVGEVDALRIEVASPIGRKRVIWVDRQSPTVLALSETVFIGQGEQHLLQMELVEKKTIEKQDLAAVRTAYGEFLRLRERLGIDPQAREFAWNAERLALLKADLPGVTEKAKGTSLVKLAQAAEQDAKNQKERAGALGALHSKLVGKAAPQPAIETLTGSLFQWQDTRDKVTVLHFWEYRDAPLEEPYGQVAYLDFLARQQKEADVRFYGVISDERVADASTKRSGVQSAKKLHGFMNLSYPLLVDTGAAIKEFGDPRATGAKLPLFVVIDRQGNIVHYHAGHYEVNRDRGLEELQKIIQAAVDKRS